MAETDPITVAHFWGRVDVSSDFQCWPWLGRRNESGYGRSGRDMAHRIAYQFVHGDIPEGLMVRHRCDNPVCCNPRHLEPGTAADNAQDAVDRGRTARGAKNGRSRLTEDDVAHIRKNPDRLTLRALAAQFNIGASTASYIRSGRSWKYTEMVDAAGAAPATSAV